MQLVTNPKMLDEVKWDNFVKANNGSIFQSPFMWKVYEETNDISPFLSAILENTSPKSLIVGIVQPEAKGILGKLYSRTIIHGGPVFPPHSEAQYIEKILRSFNTQVQKLSVYNQIRNLADMSDYHGSFSGVGYKYEDHLNILIEINKEEPELWEGLHPTRRKQIRRSYKRGISCTRMDAYEEEVINECYKMLSYLYKRISLPLASYSFIDNAAKMLMPLGYLKVFKAYYGQEIVGFRMVLTYNNSIYDWYAASVEQHKDKYINDVLPWEVIKWGSRNNYSVFDFGGAGKPDVEYGVRDFKLKFGGHLVNFGRYNKINKALLMKSGKLGLKILKLLR